MAGRKALLAMGRDRKKPSMRTMRVIGRPALVLDPADELTIAEGMASLRLVNLQSLGPYALLLLLVFSGHLPVLNAQPFWPQFRGPNGQGVAESAHPPKTFSPSENALWSVEVPPGHSSPCIWGQRIFLTTFDAGTLQCRAYNRATG